MKKTEKEKGEAGVLWWPVMPPMHISDPHRFPPEPDRDMVRRITKRYQEIMSNRESTSDDESDT